MFQSVQEFDCTLIYTDLLSWLDKHVLHVLGVKVEEGHERQQVRQHMALKVVQVRMGHEKYTYSIARRITSRCRMSGYFEEARTWIGLTNI